MVERLSRGPLSVSELARPFDITLTGAAQHVKVLTRSGLVRTEKQGRVRTCRLEAQGLSGLERWIRHTRQLWQLRLDRLGAILAEDD
jgi:DNA-binding transcriptional ArsR family regulator